MRQRWVQLRAGEGLSSTIVVEALCFEACWFGEVSQQPMCPHSTHRRRCNHHPFIAEHSTQPVPLGLTAVLMPSLSAFIGQLTERAATDAFTRPLLNRK